MTMSTVAKHRQYSFSKAFTCVHLCVGQALPPHCVQLSVNGGAGRGCTEFASDTGIDNFYAQALHRALGFEETERVVFFRKVIT